MRKTSAIIALALTACGITIEGSSGAPDVAAADAGGDAGAVADGSGLDGDLDGDLDGAPPTDASAVCPLPGLVAYYPLDVDLLDHSGNAHGLTASGVAPTVGKLGGAYRWDGVASVARVGGSLALAGARTYCAWVQPVTAVGLGQPVFVGGASGAGDMFAIQSSTPSGTCTGALADHLFLDHWGTACGAAKTTNAPAGSWSFVCFAYDGASTSTHYANGAAEPVSVSNYTYDLDTVTIGSNTIGGTTAQAAFKGAIDEVTIWGRALSTAEMNVLYASGAGCRAGAN